MSSQATETNKLLNSAEPAWAGQAATQDSYAKKKKMWIIIAIVAIVVIVAAIIIGVVVGGASDP